MKPEEITRDMLTVGCSVQISTRSRKDRHLVDGLVSEILTSSNTHPHGILVRLKSGEEGRVHGIIDNGSAGNIRAEESKDHGEIQGADTDALITSGESHYLEYKESLFWSQDLSKDELGSRSSETKRFGRDASKVIVAKVIAAFLNSDGGRLIIGLREGESAESNTVVGLSADYPKLKDKNADGFRRSILDQVIKPYFPDFVFQRIADYLEISFPTVGDQAICLVSVKKSDSRVFLKVGSESLFMIRVDASNRQLQDEEILNYCDKRF